MRALLSVIGLIIGVSGAQAQVYRGFQGNDTGGIIAWSCETEAHAHQIAAAHCARFDKFHRITGVHRQYGDYISFQCLWNPRLARYAIPAVGTRSSCRVHRHRPHVKALY
jgi:hypothetical protein